MQQEPGVIFLSMLAVITEICISQFTSFSSCNLHNRCSLFIQQFQREAFTWSFSYQLLNVHCTKQKMSFSTKEKLRKPTKEIKPERQHQRQTYARINF